MRKLFSLFILAAAVLSFTSCRRTENTRKDRLSIVATVFPEYDWVREITAGTEAGLTLLLCNGTDMHSYQPSAQDMIAVAECDLFIYVGGESDGWAERILESTPNERRRAVSLLEILGESVKEEETVEGMQQEEHHHDEDEEDGAEYDEHVWLSLRNAEVLCKEISRILSEINPKESAQYKNNTEEYCRKLQWLDSEYKAETEAAKKKTIIVADRFPFRYLADDYGLSYYAAFAGCSTESDASFETVIFLAEKADETDAGCVITIENSDKRIARSVIENSGNRSRRILTMDSMQSVRADEYKTKSYLSVMKDNLSVLRQALN